MMGTRSDETSLQILTAETIRVRDYEYLNLVTTGHPVLHQTWRKPYTQYDRETWICEDKIGTQA